MRSWKTHKELIKESGEYSKENFVVEDVQFSIKNAPKGEHVNQTQLTSLDKHVPSILDFFGIKKNKAPIGVVPIYTGNLAHAVRKAGKGPVIGMDLNAAWVSRMNKGLILSKTGEDIQVKPIRSFITDMQKPQFNDTKFSALVSFEPTPLLASLNRAVLPNLGASGGFILITKKGGSFDVDHPKSWGSISDTRFLKEYGVQVRTKIWGRGKEKIESTQFIIPKKNKNKYLFDRECFESVENKGESAEEVAKRLHASKADVLMARNRYKMMGYNFIKLK